MIINKEGNKVTPKEKAKEIVRSVIGIIESSEIFLESTSGNTEKEILRIKEQLEKIKERILKIVKPIEK